MYKKKTPIYGIPYISDGERLSGEAERLQAMILEYGLFAGTCGVPDALFEDGQYTVFDMKDGTYTLIIRAEKTYALSGIVNHHLFRSEEPVLYERLAKGKLYYIYAAYQSAMDSDPKQFARMASLSVKTGNGYVLLATVDLTGDTPTINEDPDGKVYTKDALAHATDSTNPHGREQIQDKLDVLETLKVGGREVAGGFFFFGNLPGEGQSLFQEAKGTIAHVSITPKEKGAGEVWYTIEDGGITIYNNGQPVPFSAEIRFAATL